jgi:hypothetical protein
MLVFTNNVSIIEGKKHFVKVSNRIVLHPFEKPLPDRGESREAAKDGLYGRISAQDLGYVLLHSPAAENNVSERDHPFAVLAAIASTPSLRDNPARLHHVWSIQNRTSVLFFLKYRVSYAFRFLSIEGE